MNKLKFFYSISLLTAISINLLITAGHLANYAIQFDYYANVLCENKDVKDSECNGMCHLSSELSIQNLDTEQEQTVSINFNFTPLFLQSVASNDLCINENSLTFTTPSNYLLIIHPKDIDHPPETV